jgi:hypothetical protein
VVQLGPVMKFGEIDRGPVGSRGEVLSHEAVDGKEMMVRW